MSWLLVDPNYLSIAELFLNQKSQLDLINYYNVAHDDDVGGTSITIFKVCD